MARLDQIVIIGGIHHSQNNLAGLLSQAGYTVDQYSGGQEALRAIDPQSTAAALLEVNLPDGSGVETLRAIKEKSAYTACVLITGRPTQESAIEALNAGAFAYLVEPVDPHQLLDTVRRAVEKRHNDLALLENEERTRHHLAHLEVLYNNGLKLANLVDPREIARCVIDLLAEQLNWHHAVIRLYDPEQKVMELIGFSHTGLDGYQTQQEYLRLKAIPFRMGVGLSGWVMQTGEVVRCNRLAEDPRYFETFAGMQSGLYIPMLAADKVTGVITIESERQNAFSEEDERLLVTVAAQAAAAFENARLYAETTHRMEELNVLVQVSAALRTASSRAEMLPVILKQTLAVLHADGASFCFHIPSSKQLFYELGIGDLDVVTGFVVPEDQGIAGWVLKHGQLYVTQNIQVDPLFAPPTALNTIPKAMAFAPLISQNQVLGVLLVGHRTTIEPNQVRLLITIANIAANAIHRAELHERTVNYAAELEQRVEERTRELRQVNIALEQALRSKDEFLASMSHELRTPLSGILNVAEIMQEQLYGPLNPKQQVYLGIVEESGKHLLSLINDILDLSKIEAGQLDLKMEEVVLDQTCQACLQLVRGLAKKKEQSIHYSIVPPDILLQADPRRLKQMLFNLLSNAVKFTPPKGRIGLEVTAHPGDQVVYLSVWDTGIGIKQEDFPRLFRSFSQLDASLSRKHEGTGLGLAIAQRLADQHGGSITLESTAGAGSRFTIRLPWRHERPMPVRKPLLSMAAPGDGERKAAVAGCEETQSVRLLLVDDNQVNSDITAEYLRQHGYQVILAENGQSAIEQLLLARPDLVLMDIQMPEMDGLTAIRRIRGLADEALARTPVIALTALVMPGDRELCLQAGADEYLSKPVNLRELLEAVQKRTG